MFRNIEQAGEISHRAGGKQAMILIKTSATFFYIHVVKYDPVSVFRIKLPQFWWELRRLPQSWICAIFLPLWWESGQVGGQREGGVG